MIVTLTYAEMQSAYNVGVQRVIYAMKSGLNNKYGAGRFESDIAIHLNGCAAEMAVAKGLNMFWSGGVGDLNSIDVGGKVEVRSISRINDSLIIHPSDKDGLPYVLCYNESGTPRFNLLGWIWGKQGKEERFWRDPQGTNRHAFFVPQIELFDCEELAEQIHAYKFQ